MPQSRTIDMTQGSPLKNILRYALPVILITLLNHLYGMMDTVVVGKLISTEALGAVGLTGSLNYLVSSFTGGLTGGFRIHISQQFGAKDFAKMRHAICISIYLTAVIAAGMTVACLGSLYPVLRFMHTPAGEITELAASYLRVIFLGTLFFMANNLIVGIMGAMGDTKTPLYAYLVFGALNILADFILVGYFHLGVWVTALTTVLVNAASLAYGLVTLRRRYRQYLTFHPGERQMDWRLAGVLIRLGFPVALQNATIALGVVIMQGKINSLGASSMAAYTAGSRIDTVMHQPVEVLASGLGVFAAQNFGAKRLDRIRSATCKAVWITIPVTLGCMAVCWLFGGTLAGLFLDAEAQAAIHEAESYLRVVSPFFLPLGIMSVLRASLQAMGDTATPSAAAFAELGVKLLLMFTVFSDWGLTGVVLSSAITWTLDLLIIAAAYLLRLRKVQWMLEAPCAEQKAADFSRAEQPTGISESPAAEVPAGSDESE